MTPDRSLPECPHCYREFDTVAAVVRHLNHPYSSCTNWFSPPDAQPGSPSGPPRVDPKGSPHLKFPFSGHVYDRGNNFMDHFHADKFSDRRAANVYYPFASRDEWELAAFLTEADMSMSLIDKFLSLRLIRNLTLSFHTAKALRGLVELLPSGPKWISQEIKVPGYSTKDPIVIYYRDPIQCVEWILRNPMYSEFLRYSPERRSTHDGKREYGDWITGDGAWFLQSQLPQGATLLGVTLSSDKTKISAMSGDRVAHPLLITLANLDSDIRTKSSYGAFQLLALLPVPKFIGVPQNLRGVLENRVTHACLDVVCHPLKVVARHGSWMADSLGDMRYCYTPLVGYIVDTPEAGILTGVCGNTSHLTTAFGPYFGDEFPHPPRTADQMLKSLTTLSSYVNPWQLAAYTTEARESFRLNGVNLLFWRDWALPTGVLPDPCHSFPIEALHHFHKFFWDHDLRWCIRAVGEAEIDFRFSLLQPRCGFRRFSSGISNLKQVTGREHRNIQRYILGVITGAVPAEFVVVIRTLLDIRYLAQMRRVDTTVLEEIASALKTFHRYKQTVLDNGYRVGKYKNPIDHFEIPKLELLHSVVPCIQWFGALPQWSADRTEYSHIGFIKRPKSKTNGHNYSSQICRHLDRAEKVLFFDLATRIWEESTEGAIDEGMDDTDADSDISEDGNTGNTDNDTDNDNDNDTDDTDVDIDDTDVDIDNADTDDIDVDIDNADTDVDDDVDNDTNNATVHGAERAPPPPQVRPRGPTRKPTPDFFNARPPPSRSSSALHRTFAVGKTAFRLNVKPHITRMSVDKAATKFSIPDLKVSIRDWFDSYLRDATTRAIAGRQGSVHDVQLPFEEIRVWESVQVQNYDVVGGLRPPQRLFAKPPSDLWPFGRCDTALFREAVGKGPELPGPGLDGFFVGQIRFIFYPILDVKPRLPLYLAYVQRFDVVPQLHAPRGQRLVPDPITGMYVLRKAVRSNGSPMGAVVPLYHCSTPVHLIPQFGNAADRHLTPETSMGRSKTFFLNHYFDTEDFFHFRGSL